jgi:hypothetical protein
MTLHRWLLAGTSILAIAACGFAACGGKAVIDPGAGGASSSSSAQDASSSTSNTATVSVSSSSSGGNFASCDGPGQCTLTHYGCCGPCGRPELDDLAAIAGEQQDAFRQAECPVETPCPDCEACANGDLFAYCDMGTCWGADLSEHPMNACTDNDECRLRIGTGCCEQCGTVDPFCGPITAIHVNAEATLRGLVCPEGAGECPPCAPDYPDQVVAACVGGFCRAIPID